VLLSLFASLAGCGGSEPPPPSEKAQCNTPHGQFNSVFTLQDTEGSCSGAKPESHDAIAFDDQGQFVSPAAGLVSCKTTQIGCHLQVHCTSQALLTARGSLDANLNADASELTGVGTVSGSYDGCHQVVYDVHATRAVSR
jgi:hypothetical protein